MLKKLDRISVVLGLFGLCLGLFSITHGQKFFPDEYRYYIPQNLFVFFGTDVFPPDVAMARARGIFLESARCPFYLLLYLPVAWLHYAANGFQFHVDPGSAWVDLPHANWIPAMFNVCWYVFNSFLIFVLTKRLFGNIRMARWAQVFYLLWTPNLLYARHLVPYLPSLSLLLLSFLWLLEALSTESPHKELSSRKRFLTAGMAWGSHFMTYMGYYYTGILASILILTQKIPWKARWINLCWFWIPTGVLIAIWEMLCQIISHTSFLQFLLDISASVNQGEFWEGWRLPFEHSFYLAPIPTLIATGALLVAGWLYVKKRETVLPETRPFVWVGSSVLLLYGCLVLQSTVLQKMVLYGRLLPALMVPILLLCAFVTEKGLHHTQSKIVWASRSALAVSFISLWLSLEAFWTVQYPLDAMPVVYRKAGFLLSEENLHSSRIPDRQLLLSSLAPGVALVQTRTPSTQPGPVTPFGCEMVHPLYQRASTLYLVMNREFIRPLHHVNPLDPAFLTSGKILYRAPHPYNFAPYRYEGLRPPERDAVLQSPFEMLVLENPCR